MQPKKVHIKKLHEIFNNYIKNQGKDPSKFRGEDAITNENVTNIERYAKQNSKEMIRMM